MFEYFYYLASFIKLKLYKTFSSSLKSKFNYFNLYAPLSEPADVGIWTNPKSWKLACPSESWGENLTIVGSNSTIDKSGLKLIINWLPDREGTGIVTTQTKLILELNNKNTSTSKVLSFKNVETYIPEKSKLYDDKITDYNSKLSPLKLYILQPLQSYRLVFNGYMTEEASDTNNKPRKYYVKLNMMICISSKVCDHSTEFSENFIAQQFTYTKPKCKLFEMLNELVLLNRHEFLIQARSEYEITSCLSTQTIERNSLFVWGFFIRERFDFKQDLKTEIRTKQILVYYSNGRAIHFGNNSSLMDNMSFGFASIKPSLVYMKPFECFEGLSRFNWDIIDDEKQQSMGYCRLLIDGIDNQVVGQLRHKKSSFFNVPCGSMEGWGAILISNSIDFAQNSIIFKSSLEDFKRRLACCEILSLRDTSIDINREKPLVVSINEDSFSDKNLVGAKASSLGQMQAFSNLKTNGLFNIPVAIALTRYVYDALVDMKVELKSMIETLSVKAGEGNIESLKDYCDELQNYISDDETDLPEVVVAEIKIKLVETFGIKDTNNLDERKFAVRSSSWGEDEDGMSAAGQLSTCLNISGMRELIKAVKVCLASKFSLTNIEYKRQHGLPLNMPMAVVIQEMVDCDKAGVMFTCDPANEDTGYYTITANYGLGESVVSAQADPDSIRVDARDEKLRIDKVVVGKKQVIIKSTEKNVSKTVEDDNLQNGDATVNHPNKPTNSCCLLDEEILQLASVGRSLVSYFGNQRDIEFGFKHGKLSLFQSRPITSLEQFTKFEMMHEIDTASRCEIDFATRANLCEVTPFALTPLTMTCMTRQWLVFGSKTFCKWKLYKEKDFFPPLPRGSVQISYHMFFLIQQSELFQSAGPDGKKSLIGEALEIGLFGRTINEPEITERAKDFVTPKPFWQPYWLLLCLSDFFLVPHFGITQRRKLVERLNTRTEQIYETKQLIDENGKFLPNKVFQLMLSLFEDIRLIYRDHSSSLLCLNMANVKVVMLLAKYVQDPNVLFSKLSKILASASNVISAEIPARIEAMANEIKSRGEQEASKFHQLTNQEALEYVRDDDCKLGLLWKEFITKFGHRSYNEFEFGSYTWAENPKDVIEKLKMICTGPITKPSKKLSIDELIDSLDINFRFIDRLKLKYNLIPNCHCYVRARERTKDNVVRFNGIQKKVFRILSLALQEANKIPNKELLYYFTYGELQYLLNDYQPTLVTKALKRQRLFRTEFKNEWRFDDIIKGHHYIPRHLQQSSVRSSQLKDKFYGTVVCVGVVEAKICIVESYRYLHKVKAGDIVVLHSIDIAFSPIFPLISGMITEIGGLASHGAVVAREYGLPCVVGITNALSIFKDGEKVLLDADNGIVQRIEVN